VRKQTSIKIPRARKSIRTKNTQRITGCYLELQINERSSVYQSPVKHTRFVLRMHPVSLFNDLQSTLTKNTTRHTTPRVPMFNIQMTQILTPQSVVRGGHRKRKRRRHSTWERDVREVRMRVVQASLVIRDLTLRVFAITRFREKKP